MLRTERRQSKRMEQPAAPMQIAHFVQRYPPALGGSEAFFARLSRYCASMGDRVEVHTTNAYDLEAFWDWRARTLPASVTSDQGVTIHRHPIRHAPLQRYLLKGLSLLPWPRLQAWTLPCNPIAPSMYLSDGRQSGIEVVHASALPYAWPILCAIRMARRCRAPLVLSPFLHLGDPRNPADRSRRAYLAPAMLFLLRQADAIFVQTEVERSALLDVGFAEDRLYLLGMGVEPSECTGGNRVRARRNWRIPEHAVVVGHLANKSVEKGTVDLLQAAARMTGTDDKVHLLLAGPEMPNFTRFWTTYRQRVPVTKLGVLSEEEKRDFFAACDLFAMPSRSDSFGLVFPEAWANRMPCIAYRAGGVADVIRHGTDGLLIDCGDLDGLAQALKHLAENHELRQTLGHAGHHRVERELNWGPKLARVREVYRLLIEKAV